MFRHVLEMLRSNLKSDLFRGMRCGKTLQFGRYIVLSEMLGMQADVENQVFLTIYRTMWTYMPYFSQKVFCKLFKRCKRHDSIISCCDVSDSTSSVFRQCAVLLVSDFKSKNVMRLLNMAQSS